MSLSIEELDATVRAFYEGRGETVSIQQSQNLLRTASANTNTRTAKAGADDAEPSTPPVPDPALTPAC